MMMVLGMFVFQLSTASYQQLQRQSNWRHVSNERVGDMPAYQFVGKGEETIMLEGSIFPSFKGSPNSLTALRMMGDTGKAFPMIDGTGRIYGLWVIESLSETKTIFFKNGAARKIEFSLQLKQVRRIELNKIAEMALNIGLHLLGKLL